ncbi:FABP family protein [Actinoplanes sp. NPDC051859]|uniref:FABP family protein n=1 Tax=Actinoplanes sp. NPDC051859 TaxID=3363909 RepID=UPI0037B75687
MSRDTENPLGPPPWLNAPPVAEYPYEDTHDLRQGPDLPEALLGLLPFIGLWRGRGQGGFPQAKDYNFAQEIRISHDGRPFLAFESRIWLLDDDSAPIGQGDRETGFWRPVLNANGRPTDEMEATLTTQDGVIEIYEGKAEANGTRLEMTTAGVGHTATGLAVTGGHRLFGIIEGALLYAHEMSANGESLKPHLSARLIRVGG